MILVTELHRVAAVPSLVDRAGIAEGTSSTNLRRHFDPRGPRFLVPLDHQRYVPLRTGIHMPGPFVYGEVVDRQRRGVALRFPTACWGNLAADFGGAPRWWRATLRYPWSGQVCLCS